MDVWIEGIARFWAKIQGVKKLSVNFWVSQCQRYTLFIYCILFDWRGGGRSTRSWIYVWWPCYIHIKLHSPILGYWTLTCVEPITLIQILNNQDTVYCLWILFFWAPFCCNMHSDVFLWHLRVVGILHTNNWQIIRFSLRSKTSIIVELSSSLVQVNSVFLNGHYKWKPQSIYQDCLFHSRSKWGPASFSYCVIIPLISTN